MDVTLPRLADTQVEGVVTRWLKRPGDRVGRGEPLVEVETDKVNSEIESPYDGVLTEVLAQEGATIPVGEVIARIEEDPSLLSPSPSEGEGRGGGAGAGTDRASGS